MIKATEEKEGAVENLKIDLEVKQQKIEEDKAMQESRSDPESVSSSLTSDTTRSDHSRHHQNKNGEKKRKAARDSENSSSGSDNKKSRTESSEATTEESSGKGRGSGSGTGSGSGSGCDGGKSTQGFSIGKTVSTVSELTHSNRESSSSNSGSGGGCDDAKTVNENPARAVEDEGQRSSSSISSDAAVASDKSSRDRHSGHKDVVFNNDKRSGRKRPPEEVTSLERSFELDYEEVFDKSNIPQLIATTSGKIVTWNQCFAKATGYRKAEIERMTIFSLVRPDKLSNFFDIVAAALRSDQEGAEREECHKSCTGEAKAPTDEETKTESARFDETDDAKTDSEDSRSGVDLMVNEAEKTALPRDADPPEIPGRLLDYTAMTLPCINFPAMKKRNLSLTDSDSKFEPLHVTVSNTV
jgi:PAS domain S-box-containing protein